MQYNLVFEGGGAKGLVFVGALREFERRGHTVGRVLGTSAGAITATLLAAGYSADELLSQVDEKMPDGTPRFATFMDVAEKVDDADLDRSVLWKILQSVDNPLIPNVLEEYLDRGLYQQLLQIEMFRLIFSFLELGGLYAGDAFLAWLREKLDLGGRQLGHTTLGAFHQRTGRDLTVVASDTSDGSILALNHRTAPDCPVAWAVRMSMSIPFVWREVLWRPEWGAYNGRDISGHAIVDGGINSNFPIFLLISRDREVLELMGPHDGTFTLGMLIDETLPVPNSGQEPKSSPSTSPLDPRGLPIVHRVTNLMNTITAAHDKIVIDAYKDGVCRLPAKGYGTTDFGMSDARVAALIAAGEATMRDFFDNFTPPA